MDANINIKPSDYTILIVDDVASNILLLKVLLQKGGYNVISTQEGEKVIDIVKTNNIDLILLDVMMPVLSGFEVAEKLKADPDTVSIPIIFLTALNSVTDIVNGFKVGANDFISKPFNNDELMIRVEHQVSLIEAKRIILRQTEELRKTIQGRDKLYSVIAHDLRSPLGSIKMVLNMLSLSLTPEVIGDDIYEMLNNANKSTEDLFSLLDNLLKWTKNQIGKLKVVFQNFNIVENIQGVLDVFKLVSEVKNIELIFNADKEIMVRADIDMIKTIVRNLLSNAIKFSYKNSKIEVEVKSDGKMAIVSVKDYGEGMSEEDQKKLFKTETHFSKYGTNNEEGSGLGLLLCYDFAKKNNGNLWLESEVGKGTTFYFSVPLSE